MTGTLRHEALMLKRFAGFVRPFSRLLVAAMLALTAAGIGQAAGPYLIKIGIDQHLLPGRMEGFAWIAGAYLASLLVVLAGGFVQTYTLGVLGQGVCLALRDRMFTHALRLPMSFYDRRPVGQTVTRLTNDVEALSELIGSGAVAIFSDIVLLGGVLAAMLWMNVRLALVTLCLVPVLVAITWFYRTRLRDTFRDIRNRLTRLNSFLNEAVQGIRVVRAFQAEARLTDEHTGRNADYFHAQDRSIRLMAVFNPLVSLIGTLSAAVVIWYGAGRILSRALTFGELVAFLAYAQMFYRPIRDMAEKYNILQSSFSALEKVFEFLDIEPEPSSGTARPEKLEGRIRFDRVGFSYPKHNGVAPDVLEDISFEIRPGERVALVGATGAGKSTVASLLMGFYRPISGTVSIDGRDLAEYDLPALRRRVAYVTQEPFLFTDTIAQNISLHDPSVSAERIARAAGQVGLLADAARFPERLNSSVRERGINLSAGERQLVAFARALAFDPDLLILDEATAVIDHETERRLQAALDRLCEGRTALIIAHRLSTVRSCDRILVLSRGRLVESGSHDELIRQDGLYAAFYKLQETA